MSGLNRRDVLRQVATAATAGAGVLVCQSAATAAPVPKGEAKAPPTSFTLQTEWRWCKKCEGLFYAGGAKNGVCPDGKEHDPSESGQYVMQLGSEGGEGRQSGWRRCKKCEGLFFGDEKRRGSCPAGKEHDPEEAVYTLGHTA